MLSDAVPSSNDCPCGRRRKLAACCEPYIDGDRPAPDPESLMRSRYTAFALGTPEAVDYLVATHHPDHRGPKLRERLRVSAIDVEAWTQLKVLSASENGERGLVEFVATYVIGGKQMQLHERSEFVQMDGRWLYVCGAAS